MFGNIIKTYSARVYVRFSRFSQLSTVQNVDESTPKSDEVLDTRIALNDSIPYTSSESSVLEKCQEDISHIAPHLKPSFNFAAYINKSNTLQQLVNLGVHLYKLEKKPDVPLYILQLDFEKDIKNHVIFLSDLGLTTEELGIFITKNPFIFKQELDDLNVRINYLKFKKFTDEMILRIVQDDPLWLNFGVQDIDNKLGHFQKNFMLNGSEVRSLVAKKPSLITYNINHIKLNTFVIKEEMGFSPEETKQIILSTPKLLMKNQHWILKTFEYIHKEMNIPLKTIAEFPRVLTCREFRIKQRHQFLQKLGKLQFDPKKPNYISLLAIVSGSDANFATEIAGSSIHAFNMFLKSL